MVRGAFIRTPRRDGRGLAALVAGDVYRVRRVHRLEAFGAPRRTARRPIAQKERRGLAQARELHRDGRDGPGQLTGRHALQQRVDVHDERRWKVRRGTTGELREARRIIDRIPGRGASAVRAATLLLAAGLAEVRVQEGVT